MREFCGTKSIRDAGQKIDAGVKVSSAVLAVLSAIAAGLLLIPAVNAAPLAAGQFDSLAAACAPGVSTEVLRSVAAKESHFDPFALHDNTRKITRNAVDAKAATALAQSWIAAGDSVDIGLMQINAPNLPRLGLTVAQALDPCLSLAAGAAVLRDAYRQGAPQAEQQAALLIMLSRYNTGRPLAGLVNGYVGDVIGGPPAVVTARSVSAAPSEPAAPALPDWDVWANASYAQTHGATWLVNLSTMSPTPSTKATSPTGTPTRKPQ
jgi:type IV secretion system protein VirB1